MTGLDLETFLQLLRADIGAWASLGLVVVVLALMTWTSWGSRRALRKCLVLSIGAHVGLLLYGSTFPIVAALLHNRRDEAEAAPPVRVQLAPTPGGTLAEAAEVKGKDGRSSRAVAVWDRSGDAAGLGDPTIRPIPVVGSAPREVDPARGPSGAIAPESVVLEVNPPSPTATAHIPAAPPSPTVVPADPSGVAPAVAAKPDVPTPAEAIGEPGRARPDRGVAVGATPVEMARHEAPAPALAATPSLGAPAVPGPLRDDGSPPRAGMTAVIPPASVALGDPSEVAAPKIGPKFETPSDAVAFSRGGVARARVHREAASPGVSPLAMLDPRRPTPPPLATETAVVVPPLASPTSPTAGAAVGAVAVPDAPGPLATVAADATPVGPSGPVASRRTVAPDPSETLPEADTRRRSRPVREPSALALNERRADPVAARLPRVAPGGAPALPAIAGASGLTRPAADVPPIYRSRLDANRSALARRAGASAESEQAVERALEWLRRHQDADGRWDGATAKYRDGTIVDGDDDYTSHCPPGDVCFGECYYWEADTALTGLALLAYLGSGYTHLDGQYAQTVASGLEFLRRQQKPDGDLRGRSRAVGMYCHAMATLALCEAYALTGDPKLRAPVEKAVDFLVKSRARDGLAWRYAPGAPVGDTSILGWVVMVLKSAQEVGLPIAAETRQGVLTWLGKVASGPSGGLARYQPWEKVTPTMTAEAWVCRQFLGEGGPGAPSLEAADYLLQHGPGRVQYNLYYLYYGTLAMYQHGGAAWVRWNGLVRDELLRRQRRDGHAAGSWDPDESQYGTHGGRIYGTALATLSLEVYYRYLRLYDAPMPTPPSADPNPRRTAEILAEPAPPR